MRLLVRYGAQWTAKWAGIDQAAIEADWMDQLDGMQPANVRRALERLPDDFPPTATAFKALGVSHQPPMAEDLPKLPPADPHAIKRIAEVMRAVSRPETTLTEKAAECLANLRRLRDSGTINSGQRDFLKRMEAGLGIVQTVAEIGDFVPIPASALPPSMRAAA